MPKKLNYNAVWAEAMALLKVHREAVIAIAGFFLFVGGWVFAYLLPQPDLAGIETFGGMADILNAHFRANWMYIVPAGLVGLYGGLVLYVLLTRRDLPTVGHALTKAMTFFVQYFLANLLATFAIVGGLFAFLLPGVYLAGRLAILPAVLADEPALGITGSIKRSWEVTKNAGWSVAFIIVCLTIMIWIVSQVAGLMIGLLCVLVAGPGGIPIIETGFAALFASIGAVISVALVVAIYRQLKARTPSQ